MAGFNGRLPRGGDLDAEGGPTDRRAHGPGRRSAGQQSVERPVTGRRPKTEPLDVINGRAVGNRGFSSRLALLHVY